MSDYFFFGVFFIVFFFIAFFLAAMKPHPLPEYNSRNTLVQ